MIAFLAKNWSDILSLLLSAGALITAVCANHRSNSIHRHDIQEPLYNDIKRLLDYKCDFYSAERSVRGYSTPIPCVPEDEKSAIKRKVYRYFWKSVYEQLCSILDLCAEAESINWDMKILFDLIKNSDPEKYNKLKEIFYQQEDLMSESEELNAQAFLSTISIPFYQFIEEVPGKPYDYLELNASLEELSKKIREERKSFEDRVEEILMKK